MMPMPASRAPRLMFGLIVAAYLTIASLYALLTPAWQAPDEPAHYNYIRHLAEQRALPVLQAGDYDQAYLEEIKARHFPPEMAIDPIRYESHQPPLYYALATPLYWLADGSLLALRLFSVLLGAALLWVTWRILEAIFPARAWLALGGVAFVAFLPQHVAMSAAVNNDVLGELMLAAAAALSLAYLRGGRGGGRDDAHDRRLLVALALVTAAGLWTKTSAYLALPLALLAILWRARDGAPLGSRLALGLGPALLLGLPWWARNWAVYGAGDLLGLRRHDAVVVGQPRTVEWLAQMGLLPFLRQALETTFHSFWGQFGWMGVLLDSRIYLALQMLTLLVALGLGWALWEMMRSGELTSFQRRALAFLGAWLALTAASYLWYNLTFVQHQGRYLFPALPVWGLAFALGWSQALQPRCSRWGSVFFLALTALYVGEGLWSGDVNKWAAAMAGALAIALGINSWLLPAWLRRWIAPLVYVGLAALDLLALWGFILPQLS